MWVHQRFQEDRLPWEIDRYIQTLEEYEELIVEYYGRQGIEVHDVSFEDASAYCYAIGCGGYIVYLLIVTDDLDEMKAFGYEMGGP